MSEETSQIRPHLVASLVQDSPWLVSIHVPKDTYVPKRVNFTKVIKEQRTVTEDMTAGDARERGAKVDPSIPDDTVTTAEWLENVEKTVTWTETRLCFRGKLEGDVVHSKTSTRQEKVRQEIAEALKNPYEYIRYEKLIGLIRTETDHWRNHNMHDGSIRPIVLVFLGNDEEDGVYARSVYYIKHFDPHEMVVADSSDQEYDLVLGDGVFDSARIHRFTIFFPSNVSVSKS